MARRFTALLCFLFFCGPAGAQQTYDIVSPLTFGTFAVTANDAAYHLTISNDNVLSKDNVFVIGTVPPSAGEMVLENLPADTDITVMFDDGTLDPAGGGGASFTVSDFTISTNRSPPVQFQTDGAGRLTLYYGATLRTSGDGQPYPSGNYSGSFDIVIDY